MRQEEIRIVFACLLQRFQRRAQVPSKMLDCLVEVTDRFWRGARHQKSMLIVQLSTWHVLSSRPFSTASNFELQLTEKINKKSYM